MKVETIQDYIETLNENGKTYVNTFIVFMNKNYPQLHSRISFSMPMWFVGKKMNEGYIGISAAKNHFSIHFSDETFVVELGQKFKKCKTGKRCINIKYGDDESFEAVQKSIHNFINMIL